MGWLSGYSYRKQITINGSSGGAQTNYPLKLTVHRYSSKFSDVWDSGVIATGTGADVARNIVIDGNYLYAVSQASKLVIYDISTPSSPVQKSLTSLNAGAIDIRKKDHYVFISGSTDAYGLTVYDVSNVEAPSYVTVRNLGGLVHGMFLSGNYLYCCLCYVNKFVIVDVTDPTNPVIKGSLTSSTYLHGAHDTYVDGNYAYVTNCFCGAGEYGFTVINVTNKDSPSIVTGVGESDTSSHILKVGNYVYLGAHEPDAGLTVWEVSTPSSPIYKGRFFAGEGNNLGYWMGSYDANTLGLVACDSRRLYLIDISTPDSPNCLTSVFLGATSRPKNVAITGNYFYTSIEDTISYQWRIRSFQKVSAPDSGEDVYLNKHCQEDYDDIRFTKSDGSTELDHWREIYSLIGNNAVFWIKFDSIPTGSSNFYIYYGNSGAGSNSNGATTFIKFDDFERGNNGDPVGGEWAVSGSVIISTEQAYGGTRCAKLVGSGSVVSMQISRPAGIDYAVRFRIWKEAIASSQVLHGNGTKAVYWNFVYVDPTGELLRYYDTSWHTLCLITPNQWLLNEGNDFNWTSYIYDIWLDNVKKQDNAGMFANAGWANVFYLDNAASGVGNDIYIDDFIIRKWVSPEPTWGTWGSEESPPAVAAMGGSMAAKLVGAGAI